MKITAVSTALLAGLSLASATGFAHDERAEHNGLKPVTIAVFGDWPYSQNLLDNHVEVSSTRASAER